MGSPSPTGLRRPQLFPGSMLEGPVHKGWGRSCPCDRTVLATGASRACVRSRGWKRGPGREDAASQAAEAPTSSKARLPLRPTPRFACFCAAAPWRPALWVLPLVVNIRFIIIIFPLEKKLIYFGPVGDELLAGTLGGPWEMVVTSGRAARWP